ncbi:MAG TPA: hypothetical protein VK821_14190 [Dehalococcoidia bacterium]|nr:hypothetical protein [Dehalococcoidia bacterium]
MQSQEFLDAVRDQTLALLPDALRDAQARVHYAMLQIHFGEPRAHYEVWLVRKTGRIEIGLHFEADRERSHMWAEAIAERSLEVRDALGPDAELEEWTPSWTRLHLTLPLETLGASLCGEVAARLAGLIQATCDYVESIPVRRREYAEGEPHSRREYWRHRRRRAGSAGAS